MYCKGLFLGLGCAFLTLAQSQSPPGGRRDVREIDMKDPLEIARPRSYAVIIGIAKYKNLPPGRQLYFPERDAQSIYTVLTSLEGGGFKAENVHLLIGDDANLANIRHNLNEWLPSVSQNGDRVLVYFAGHGDIYEGKGYLAPAEYDLDHPVETGYPMEELGEVIGSRIHAKDKILLTDACHSGAIAPEDINNKLLNLRTSTFSLTASRDREKSIETPDLQGGHGVFTYYVVKGMEGEADTNQDGKVTADELAEYVRRRVREDTNNEQNPTSDRASYDPEMLLSFIPEHIGVGTRPKLEVGSIVFEANKMGVEVFLDDKLQGVLSEDQKTLTIPGLQPGPHWVRGVRMGYEPDGPRQEMVYPGLQTTVTFNFHIFRRRDKKALELFDKGYKAYSKGDRDNYQVAINFFEEALKIDPKYSQAAYYLGTTYNALFDQRRAEQSFNLAIQIDPDFLVARIVYAGMLIDIENVDGALRQINYVLNHGQHNALALTMKARALNIKALFAESIKTAREAIQLAPRDAEPHMWLADSLRGDGKCKEARLEYQKYLELSDFDSKLAGQLHYWIIGSLIAAGKRKRAGQHDIWVDLQSLAWFGMCDCEKNNAAEVDTAIHDCQNSLRYTPNDAYGHLALGIAFMNRFNRDNDRRDVDPAKKHLLRVIELEPDSDEAGVARQELAIIKQAFPGR